MDRLGQEAKPENCVIDPKGILWREREPKLIEGCSHIIALRGAGSVNGISIADAKRILSEQLFPRVREMLKDKGKVAFIFDGDDDDRAYPDIGYIIGRIRDEFDSTNCKFIAVQKDDWWSGDGKPIRNANGREYETYIIDAKSPPENTGGLPYTGQQGTEHNALSQSITLVNSGKYTQWYVGAVGPIAEQQISDLDMKSDQGINVIVFKTPVSTEQAINLQHKIDVSRQLLNEIDIPNNDASEDVKLKIQKEKDKLARLLSSQDRRAANPFGSFFDKDGKDKGVFKNLKKTQVEVVEV